MKRLCGLSPQNHTKTEPGTQTPTTTPSITWWHLLGKCYIILTFRLCCFTLCRLNVCGSIHFWCQGQLWNSILSVPDHCLKSTFQTKGCSSYLHISSNCKVLLSFKTMDPFSTSNLSNEPRHEKICLCHMRTTKAQISLRIRAV